MDEDDEILIEDEVFENQLQDTLKNVNELLRRLNMSTEEHESYKDFKAKNQNENNT